MTGAAFFTLRRAAMALMVGLVAVGLLVHGADAAPPSRPARLLSSAIVSPRPKLPIKLNHKKHENFPCKQCHAKAATSSNSGDVLLPKMKACETCHPEAKVPPGHGRAGQRNVKKCRKCHTSFNHKGFPARVVWPKPRYKFPHRLHRGRGMGCLTCHKGVKTAKTTYPLHLPKMKTCLDCHRRKRRAGTRCVTCHERIPGGLMRTVYPAGVVKPGPSLPRLNHGPLFKTRHKVAARGNKRQCYECHRKATCLRCHGGVRRPARIHLGNWKLRHGRSARANRSRCKSCHTRQRFCLRCHQRAGLGSTSARSPYRTPGIRRYHQPGWSSSTAGGLGQNRHGVHARRNIGTCVSCHRERDCMRCHARRRIGGLGRNPHGPGFRFSARCRLLRKRNRRACLKCHGFNDRLLQLCR